MVKRDIRVPLITCSVVLIMLVVGGAMYAQDNTTVTTGPVTTTTLTLPAARKSYPLPEPLATKIYESQDETIRAAVFDRQSKLYSQFSAAMKQINEWILAQRKEFKCDACEASRDKDGKWSFAEPEQPQSQPVAAAQGGAK